MKFQLEPHETYLHVTVNGPYVADVARACVESVYAACREHDLLKVLFDARGITEGVTISDRHGIATYLADLHDIPIRCAVLVPTALMTTKTLEHAATNRGAPVRTTDSVADACAWLEIPLPR